MKPITFYIAGPMRNLPECNYPAFRAATDRLRAAGHTVISPVELDEADGGVALYIDPTTGNATCTDDVFRRCLARDLAAIAREADALYVLDGWQKSRGARIEMQLAMGLGLRLHFQTVPDRKTWCEAWKSLNAGGCGSYATFVNNITPE